MVEVVKEENYIARRNEILDAAHRLVYTKGYEQMTIQDILAKRRFPRARSTITSTRNRRCWKR